MSAGLKAFTTSGAVPGIEQCRLCCGGHGYSLASGLPKIYVNTAPSCTYEGENTVMLLQMARYLAKSYEQAQRGLPLARSVSYLAAESAASFLDSSLTVAALTDAYRHRAARLVKRACMKFLGFQAAGSEPHDAWNMSSVYFVRAAEAHCHLLVVETFAERLSQLKVSAPLTTVLTDLFRLYAAYGISINSGEFTEDGYVTAALVDVVNDGVLLLLRRLRPNIVALVDAFDFTDGHLQSVLGRYDGHVYENLYKWAAASPLNDTRVHESHDYLKNAVASKL